MSTCSDRRRVPDEMVDQGGEADIQKKLYKEFNGDMIALHP